MVVVSLVVSGAAFTQQLLCLLSGSQVKPTHTATLASVFPHTPPFNLLMDAVAPSNAPALLGGAVNVGALIWTRVQSSQSHNCLQEKH